LAQVALALLQLALAAQRVAEEGDGAPELGRVLALELSEEGDRGAVKRRRLAVATQVDQRAAEVAQPEGAVAAGLGPDGQCLLEGGLGVIVTPAWLRRMAKLSSELATPT
jgi:hypothetical protein